MSMMSEFKDFAVKGNMIDLAIGFIMGGAFATVIKSLVSNIIMPPIGYLMGGVDFSKLAITLGKALDGKTDVAIKYGAFINACISFVILAFCVFLLVKSVNNIKKRFEEEAESAPAKPSSTDKLLEEIRDELKKSA
jgi:large conductance mechanosensitive channel